MYYNKDMKEYGNRKSVDVENLKMLRGNEELQAILQMRHHYF